MTTATEPLLHELTDAELAMLLPSDRLSDVLHAELEFSLRAWCKAHRWTRQDLQKLLEKGKPTRGRTRKGS